MNMIIGFQLQKGNCFCYIQMATTISTKTNNYETVGVTPNGVTSTHQTELQQHYLFIYFKQQKLSLYFLKSNRVGQQAS